MSQRFINQVPHEVDESLRQPRPRCVLNLYYDNLLAVSHHLAHHAIKKSAIKKSYTTTQTTYHLVAVTVSLRTRFSEAWPKNGSCEKKAGH